MIKVRAIRDGFMDPDKFCTKGKEYEVITQNTDTFMIMDDGGDEHSFGFNDNRWFEFMEDAKAIVNLYLVKYKISVVLVWTDK